MKKKNKTILVNGEKVKFIPATEFQATYHWQRTNKEGQYIPDHIWDKGAFKRARDQKIKELTEDKKNKENEL
jgi:hypothetical protein